MALACFWFFLVRWSLQQARSASSRRAEACGRESERGFPLIPFTSLRPGMFRHLGAAEAGGRGGSAEKSLRVALFGRQYHDPSSEIPLHVRSLGPWVQHGLDPWGLRSECSEEKLRKQSLRKRLGCCRTAATHQLRLWRAPTHCDLRILTWKSDHYLLGIIPE